MHRDPAITVKARFLETRGRTRSLTSFNRDEYHALDTLKAATQPILTFSGGQRQRRSGYYLESIRDTRWRKRYGQRQHYRAKQV